MGHCSERTLISVLRAAHFSIPKDIIARLYRECQFQSGVHRATPPHVSCWVSKYNGEVVAVDARYPFIQSNTEIQGGKWHVIFIVDSLSRYANCSWMKKLEGVVEKFPNGWVRARGIPRRIITDGLGPGFRSKARGGTCDISGWQIVADPPIKQPGNGLFGRTVRSLQTATRY